jgi:hypothetical protein
MLIVPNETARWVGRKGGLAGAAQAEEKRGHTIFPDVRRTVHRKDFPLRQDKVHDSEDAFLLLAGIFCAADQYDLAREIRDDESV